MKHHCEPKRRAQELMSPVGQAAYGYYKDWMSMKKYSQPSSMAFLESRYYRAFINFATLVADANISRPDKYMQLMVEADVLPILWCREQCYSIYLEWMDKRTVPLEEAASSMNYLFDISEKEGASIEDIFQHLGPQRVLSLVRQRRLSPWFLFCSKKFGSLLKTLDKPQLSAFNTVVNSSYWAGRFQQEKTAIEEIKKLVEEVGL
jgi:hypothetical protein